MIHGISVILHQRTQTGTDPFGAPVYEVTPVRVDDVLVGQPSTNDVLVGQPSTDDIATTLDLTGRRAQYWLAIPKGDAHDWEDAVVEIPAPMAGTYRAIGIPIAGIEENIPLRWNRKVLVERYG